MSRLWDFMKRKKVRIIFISLFVLLLPVYAAWLSDFEWAGIDAWGWFGSAEHDEGTDNEEYFENLDYQLANVRCPARSGLELRDYWECLWHTSITTEGKRQHEQLLWEDYLEGVDYDLKMLQRRMEGIMKRSGTGGNKTMTRKRVRRASGTAADEYIYYKLRTHLIDTNWPFFNRKSQNLLLRFYFWRGVKKCQQDILPGVKIQTFLECIRHLTLEYGKYDQFFYDQLGQSYNATFQPTTFPPLNYSEYADEDFPLPEVTDTRSNTRFVLRFDFKPLGDEEKLSNFYGADPYFDDNFSPFRYRYDNLDPNQRQPAWSYRGKDGSKAWHNLDLERFYVPMKKSADVSKVEFGGDLVQTYPATGELPGNIFPHLQTPLDYRWTKDHGYSAYTRYLLPLLQKNDLEYYKGKGLIDPSVSVRSDGEQLKNVVNDLTEFLAATNQSIDRVKIVKNKVFHLAGKFSPDPEEKVKLAPTYLNLIGHYFGVDIGRYRAIKLAKSNRTQFLSNQLEEELEIGRTLLRSYVDVVIVQTACVKEMVDQYDYRIEDEAELKELIEKAMAANNTCQTAENAAEAIQFNPAYSPAADKRDFQYRVTRENLRKLYGLYYDRQDARRRYSLPKYPVPFPICKHNEPSPIDILTDRGSKSSLRDYTFGPAAYRLNRFFMFFPLDGSPLLTVGIKDGERLDGSSVQLSGGAVKGQNLTFQYMHLRYSYKWNEIGSEHWINGKGAPMELQMVFTISGSADPIKYWHVLARVQNQLFQFREKLVIIISVLVDVLPTDDDVKEKIEKDNLKQDPYVFEPLAQAAFHFRSVPQKYPTFEQPRGYVSRDPVFRFIDFIPKKSSKFYTYRGSLSWPPCFGYVVWSVFEQRLYMSKRQFDQFAKIPAYGIQDDNFAHNNFRRFDDIYVEEEHDPQLRYEEIQEKKEERTVNRNVLVGFHEVAENGLDVDEPLVDEAIYYIEEPSTNCGTLKSLHGVGGLAALVLIIRQLIEAVLSF